MKLEGNEPTVGTPLFICDTTALPTDTCDAPIQGNVVIKNTLDAAVFNRMGCTEIVGNLKVEVEATFHHLKRVTGSVTVASVRADTFIAFADFPALKTVDGRIDIGYGVQDVSLEALAVVGGYVWVRGSSIEIFAATSLLSAQHLDIGGNDDLYSLEVPLLTAPSLNVTSNLKLPTCLVEQLRDRMGATGTIERNSPECPE